MNLIIQNIVPETLNDYRGLLQEFISGMVIKLDKNSHKSTPTRKDVHQIMALLLREVAEFLEQVSEDRTNENTAKELYDISNFAFLAYIALKMENQNA